MNNQLFYPNNGSFRILVLADIQENRVLTEAYKKKLLSIIDEMHPQLIVLLGDMIFGPVMFTKKTIQADNFIATTLGVNPSGSLIFMSGCNSINRL